MKHRRDDADHQAAAGNMHNACLTAVARVEDLVKASKPARGTAGMPSWQFRAGISLRIDCTVFGRRGRCRHGTHGVCTQPEISS